MAISRLPKREDYLNDIHNHSIYIPTREIYLHGHFADEEPGVDYRMAVTFIKNIHLLERMANATIVVHMHTVGGEWNDGMAIYDAIKYSPCPVVVIAYAHSRSMSSIIPQAADKRIIMPHTDFMIHYGSIALEDVSVAAKSAIDWNEKLSGDMLDVYADRCIEGEFFIEKNMTYEQIKKFLDKKMRQHIDWWLDAEESVSYGFMDGVYGTKGFETMNKIRRTKKIIW